MKLHSGIEHNSEQGDLSSCYCVAVVKILARWGVAALASIALIAVSPLGMTSAAYAHPGGDTENNVEGIQTLPPEILQQVFP